MAECHATKQMRSAIERAEAKCNAARAMAEKIEYGRDAREDEGLRDMAVAINDLMLVVSTALDRCAKQVDRTEGA